MGDRWRVGEMGSAAPNASNDTATVEVVKEGVRCGRILRSPKTIPQTEDPRGTGAGTNEFTALAVSGCSGEVVPHVEALPRSPMSKRVLGQVRMVCRTPVLPSPRPDHAAPLLTTSTHR